MTTTWPRPKPSSSWDRTTRSIVHRAGRRFRTNLAVMHGTRPTGQGAFCTPDLTFVRQKVAVFLDGCYWHGCPDHHPKRAVPYDALITDGLRRRGWTVLRLWECAGSDAAAAEVLTATSTRKPGHRVKKVTP